MTEKVSHIPEGFHTIQAVINVAEFEAVIAFVKQVFDAVEIERIAMPSGAVHVEVKIGDTVLMLGPADPLGEFPAKLFVHVEDCDAIYARALAAGARSIMEPAQQFYGQRSSRVQDDWGNLWVITTQNEIVPPAELHRRFAKMVGG